jgi:hypothetical protein
VVLNIRECWVLLLEVLKIATMRADLRVNLTNKVSAARTDT